MKVSIKDRMRGYIIFTSFGYRIIVYIAMPAALAAIGIWGGIHVGDIGLLLTGLLLPVAETISDSWLFGGIQTRDAEKMDYLRASGRGMEVMRGALVIDLIRKFCAALGIMALCWLVIGPAKGAGAQGPGGGGVNLTDFIGRCGALVEWGIFLYLALLSYAASALGTFVSRFGNMVWGNVMAGYGAMVLAAVGLWGITLSNGRPGPLFVLNLGLAALGLAVSFLAVRIAMRKVEGGYHDK